MRLVINKMVTTTLRKMSASPLVQDRSQSKYPKAIENLMKNGASLLTSITIHHNTGAYTKTNVIESAMQKIEDRLTMNSEDGVQNG